MKMQNDRSDHMIAIIGPLNTSVKIEVVQKLLGDVL